MISDILRLDRDGTDSVALGVGNSPSWSPTGEYVLYAGAGDDQGYVMVVDPAGGVPMRVVEGRAPTWPPDGRRIACVGVDRGDRSGAHYVAVVPVEGGHERRLRFLSGDQGLRVSPGSSTVDSPPLECSIDGSRSGVVVGDA